MVKTPLPDVQVTLLQENLEQMRRLYKEIKLLNQTMSSLATVTQDGTTHVAYEDHPIYITIPDGGDSYALAAGDTYIDFYQGTITKPDGTTERLRLNLKSHGINHMRSFLIISDKTVKINLDGGGYHSLKSGEGINFGGYPIRQVYIQATEATNIRVMASTANQLTTFYDRTFSIDNPLTPPTEPVTVTGSSAVAQQVDLDAGEYGRNLVEVFGKSTVALNWYYDTSPDGLEWYNEETFAAQTEVHSGYQNVARYQRFRTAAGAAGTVTLTMIAGR